MAFPHRRRTPLRARLPCGEHSAPSTRERPHSSRSPSPVSGFPSVVSSLPASQAFGVTNAQPMPSRLFGADSRSISTFEPSFMVISRVCQSTVRTNESKKFVPRTPETTRFLTTTTGTRPLQRPSCNGTTPTPLMHIRRPSASSIVPVSLSKGSPPEATCQRDSGITETTAPVSSSKETLVPLSLPFTHGVSPVCSPAIDNTLRFPGLPLCVPVGGRWVRRLSCGQSRRRWPKPPQLKQPSLLAAGRAAVDSCSSSFKEIFLTSRIRSSMGWVASVFSGFGLPVRVCRLCWKSSSARMTLPTNLRASVRVAGSRSRIARYASFEVIPPAKRATRSRSVTPALRPTSATSWAYCSMVWPSRWCRAWNRSISCPVDSSGPYASSNLFLNSSKELSLVCPAGYSSRRTESLRR
ncbi:hypothetical protein T10_162 [Trichinella papuae]|uniref:Uncharacterized protein n=1 Tax=Trichinella papuae TaxID=268474 RepID=A0A0V1MDC1_9BILA|nr:hypothetical protein T10_162 [Trichinella papuae]